MCDFFQTYALEINVILIRSYMRQRMYTELNISDNSNPTTCSLFPLGCRLLYPPLSVDNAKYLGPFPTNECIESDQKQSTTLQELSQYINMIVYQSVTVYIQTDVHFLIRSSPTNDACYINRILWLRGKKRQISKLISIWTHRVEVIWWL